MMCALRQDKLDPCLLLVNRLLDVPIPSEFRSVLKKYQNAQRLANMALKVCLTSAACEIKGSDGWKLHYIYNFLYDAQLQVGWKNKLKSLLTIFRPNADDIMLITIPERLYPLYYVIRPFTYLGRGLRSLFFNK